MSSRKRTGARRCGHENADHLMPGDIFDVTDGWDEGSDIPVHVAQCEQLRCLDCGAWLSLGPARDDGEHAERIAVEVRAAELAASDRVSLEQWPIGMVGCEPHGWIGHRNDDTPINPDARYWAGYLARHIATHTEES